MQVLDPGHMYDLKVLDNTPEPYGVFLPDGKFEVIPPVRVGLLFVKREGEGYPGNVGHHPGTTTQEVLRALIDRTRYVDNQIPDPRNILVINSLQDALMHLELRAAERHGRLDSFIKLFMHRLPEIETLPTCPKCNHIGCVGDCRQ